MNSVFQVHNVSVNIFLLLLHPVVHSIAHLLPTSRLPTVHISLVALTHFPITVLHRFTSTTYAENYAVPQPQSSLRCAVQFHSR